MIKPDNNPPRDGKDGKQFIDTHRAATLLGVQQYTVRRYLDAGILTGYQISEGGRRMVLKQSVMDLLERIRRQVEQADPPPDSLRRVT